MATTTIRLLTAAKEKPGIAALSAAGIFFLFPSIQLITTPLAFDIWFRDLSQKPLNSILYFIFSILFGMFISLFLYTRNKCFDCGTERAGSGFVGSILGFIFGVCPACFSFVGLLLPLGPSLFLTTYSPLFTILSISIIAFSIFKLGGFKRTTAVANMRAEKERD